MRITSTHNPRIKAAARLRERRDRDRERRYLVDGARELSRALAAGVDLAEAFACETLASGAEARAALAELHRRNVPLTLVAEPVFAKLAYGDRADGVLGVAIMQPTGLDALFLPPDSLVAVVEGAEKPGNLGAVLRSADAAGIAAVIAADPRTDWFNPNVIRASLGTLFSMPIATGEASQIKSWLQSRGFRLLAARVDGAAPYTQADYRGDCAIVLGSEAAGLSPTWQDNDVTGIRLPMKGQADSLNLSASAAVLFFEALRQRAG